MRRIDAHTGATHAESDVLGRALLLRLLTTWAHAADAVGHATGDDGVRDAVLRGIEVLFKAVRTLASYDGLVMVTQDFFGNLPSSVCVAKEGSGTAGMAVRTCPFGDGVLLADAKVLDAVRGRPLAYHRQCAVFSWARVGLTLAEPVEFDFITDAATAELGAVAGKGVGIGIGSNHCMPTLFVIINMSPTTPTGYNCLGTIRVFDIPDVAQ